MYILLCVCVLLIRLYYADPHPVHGVQLMRVGKLQHHLGCIEDALESFKEVKGKKTVENKNDCNSLKIASCLCYPALILELQYICCSYIVLINADNFIKHFKVKHILCLITSVENFMFYEFISLWNSCRKCSF